MVDPFLFISVQELNDCGQSCRFPDHSFPVQQAIEKSSIDTRVMKYLTAELTRFQFALLVKSESHE